MRGAEPDVPHPSVPVVALVLVLKAVTAALRGNSDGPQQMKARRGMGLGPGAWGLGLGAGGAAQLRLLLSVERASTTLEFNAFLQRRRLAGPRGK